MKTFSRMKYKMRTSTNAIATTTKIRNGLLKRDNSADADEKKALAEEISRARLNRDRDEGIKRLRHYTAFKRDFRTNWFLEGSRSAISELSLKPPCDAAEAT